MRNDLPNQLSATAALRCIKCRYPLRGLPIDGVCPECSTPVSESAPPPYLTSWGVNDLLECRQIHYGVGGIARLVLAVVTIPIVLWLVFFLIPALFGNAF